MKPLYEKYRPQSFEDVVGQDKAIARIRQIASRGVGGRAFWISGKSGTGKTTLAWIIARQVAGEGAIRELDAGDCTPAKIREIESDMRFISMFEPGGHAFIVNEAHGLRKDAIRQFLVLLERLPGHTCIIFTTTFEGEDRLFEDDIDSSPLMSRCIRVPLTSQGLAKVFAAKAKQIAQAEGLDGKSLSDYEKLVYKHKCNLRAVLQEIDAGVMME